MFGIFVLKPTVTLSLSLTGIDNSWLITGHACQDYVGYPVWISSTLLTSIPTQLPHPIETIANAHTHTQIMYQPLTQVETACSTTDQKTREETESKKQNTIQQNQTQKLVHRPIIISNPRCLDAGVRTQLTTVTSICCHQKPPR